MGFIMAKSRITNELTVLTTDHLSSNAKVITQYSQKSWNSVVLKTLGKKLAQGRQSHEYRHGDSVKVEVHFQNGSVASFVFIPSDFTLFQVHEAMRDAFSPTIKESTSISYNLMFLNEDSPWRQESIVDALSSLTVLSFWDAPNYETDKDPKKKMAVYGFYTHLNVDLVRELIREAEIKAYGTNQVRSLAMMPANKLNSKSLVDFALSVASRLKVESRFLSVSDLKNMGAGAFCAVLQGSESDGGIVVLRRPGKTREVALVGKGVTFDTGGHDLKTDSSMFGMHRDMTGAAVALSAFEALSKINPDLSLSCYLAIGENMISERAYKPGDVITSLSGQTIEIENTDAEGRLMLADTLTLVNKEITKKDALIIDFATLTGAALDVLGNRWAIAMTKKENLWAQIAKSGKKSGERVHALPILEEFEDAVTSDTKIADLAQCTGYAHAEHCYAAAFLSHFVKPEKTHIHIDLACEERDGGLGLVSSNVTGFGVRWAVDFILKLTSQ